jgi:hypothetical protein
MQCDGGGTDDEQKVNGGMLEGETKKGLTARAKERDEGNYSAKDGKAKAEVVEDDGQGSRGSLLPRLKRRDVERASDFTKAI